MKGNYLKEVLIVFGTTILLLLFVGLIPDFTFKYKHFNMLSDILRTDSTARELDAEEIENQGTTENEDELSALAKDSVKSGESSSPVIKDTSYVDSGKLRIEDFSKDKKYLLPFYEALQNERTKRPIRIGVLGDSFIEADIITGKLRDLLQTRYGGKGVGFVPVASPAAGFRTTVQLASTGWNTSSIIHYKKVNCDKFCLSGLYFTPNENATMSLKTVGKPARQLSFFFINEKHTQISVSINNQPATVYTPKSSGHIQQLVFPESDIKSAEIQVQQVEGFTGFGLYLGDHTGIYVDNFSVRGSSGSVLSQVNKELSLDLTQHIPYDLIIVQYGVNAIDINKRYSSYKRMMADAIRNLQECYPNVPIVTMSIGDKGYKISNGIVTHPGVLPLIDVQRDLAKEAGIAFWNTFKAMGGEKSMVKFVEHKPSMANKDYTHINYLGGDKIAEQLFESLMNENKRFLP